MSSAAPFPCYSCSKSDVSGFILEKTTDQEANEPPVSKSMDNELVLLSVPFQQKSSGNWLFCRAWISISIPSPHLSSHSVAVWFYCSLSLSFLLNEMLEGFISKCSSAAVCYLCMNRWMLWLGWTEIYLQNYMKASCFHLCGCLGPATPSNKALNYPPEGLNKRIPCYYHLAFLQLFIF